jgi:hypothetical protein
VVELVLLAAPVVAGVVTGVDGAASSLAGAPGPVTGASSAATSTESVRTDAAAFGMGLLSGLDVVLWDRHLCCTANPHIKVLNTMADLKLPFMCIYSPRRLASPR